MRQAAHYFLLVITSLVLSIALGEALLWSIASYYMSSLTIEQAESSLRMSESDLTFLVLGESTSTPFLVNPNEDWVSQLQKLLFQRKGIKVEIINLSRPAITSKFLVDRAQQAILKHHPHVLFSMMGVNDNMSDQFLVTKKRSTKNWFYKTRVYRLLSAFLTESGENVGAPSPTKLKPIYSEQTIFTEDRPLPSKLLPNSAPDGMEKTADQFLNTYYSTPRKDRMNFIRQFLSKYKMEIQNQFLGHILT